MKIPEAVKKRAKQLAYNTVTLLGYKDGNPVWGLSSVDKDGVTIPTGFPFLIVKKGDKFEEIDGIEALSFSYTPQEP